MDKKFEKLTLSEIGIISFMALILIVSLAASWYNGEKTGNKEASTSQQTTATKSAGDGLQKQAETAVLTLEIDQTEASLKAAQAAVDKLKDAAQKKDLQARIDLIKEAMGQQKNAQTEAKLKAELVRAEAARKLEAEKKAAEEQKVADEQEETYVAPVQNTYTPPASQPSQASSEVASSSSTAAETSPTSTIPSTTEPVAEPTTPSATEPVAETDTTETAPSTEPTTPASGQ